MAVNRTAPLPAYDAAMRKVFGPREPEYRVIVRFRGETRGRAYVRYSEVGGMIRQRPGLSPAPTFERADAEQLAEAIRRSFPGVVDVKLVRDRGWA